MDEEQRRRDRETGALAHARYVADRRRRGADDFALVRPYVFSRVRLVGPEVNGVQTYFLDFLDFADFLRGLRLYAWIRGRRMRFNLDLRFDLDAYELAVEGLRMVVAEIAGAAGFDTVSALLTIEIGNPDIRNTRYEPVLRV